MRSIPLHLEKLGCALGATDTRNANPHAEGRSRASRTPKDRCIAPIGLSTDIHLLQAVSTKAPERILNQERSTSGVIFYWGVKGTHPAQPAQHPFHKDYRAEFNCIQHEGTPGEDTVYINITSKELPQDAPEGELFVPEVEANPEMWTTTQWRCVNRSWPKSATSARAPESRTGVQTQSSSPSMDRGAAVYGVSSNSAAAAFRLPN